MSLTFREEDHSYQLKGEPIPSVSKVIEALKDFSMVAPDVLKRAQDFGTANHLMVKLHILGQLDYGSLDDALFGPLEAWEKFLDEIQPFSTTTGLLIDIKSRPYDRVADPVQLAAYYQLWKENRELVGKDPWVEKPLASPVHRYAGTPDILIPPRDGSQEFLDHRILYLGRDGKYTYTPCYGPNAWPVFGRLLGDYHRARTTEEIIKSWRNRV